MSFRHVASWALLAISLLFGAMAGIVTIFPDDFGSAVWDGREIGVATVIAAITAAVAAFMLDRQTSSDLEDAKADTARAHVRIAELNDDLIKSQLEYERLHTANLELERRIAPRGFTQEGIQILRERLQGVVPEVSIGSINDIEANNFSFKTRVIFTQIGINVRPILVPIHQALFNLTMPGVLVMRDQGGSVVLENALKEIGIHTTGCPYGGFEMNSPVPLIWISAKLDPSTWGEGNLLVPSPEPE